MPQRIMIETSKNGPVVLQSFLNPQYSRPQTSEAQGAVDGNGTVGALLDQTREALRPMSGSTEGPGEDGDSSTVHGDEAGEETGESDITANGQLVTNGDKGKEISDAELPAQQAVAQEDVQLAPLLIATVVAPSHDHEARRAARRLEALGVEFQRRWVKEQAAAKEAEQDDGTADG
jgi:hypothetical protein